MTFHAERYPADWPTIRAAILARAGNRCEQCAAENHTVIVRGEHGNEGSYMVADGHVFDADTGAPIGRARGSEYDGRWVRIILTIAHLDHNERNNAPENLAALCQRCHLAHDREDNARRVREGRDARRGQGRLAL